MQYKYFLDIIKNMPEREITCIHTLTLVLYFFYLIPSTWHSSDHLFLFLPTGIELPSLEFCIACCLLKLCKVVWARVLTLSLALQLFLWHLGKGSALLKQGIFRFQQTAGWVCVCMEPKCLTEKCGEADVPTHPLAAVLLSQSGLLCNDRCRFV